MSSRFALLLLVPMISGAATQPAPAISEVANAASNLAPGLPGSGIAQGSIFTVYGSNLGPASPCSASTTPYTTPLCGVSLTVTVNGTSTYPIPTFVYPTQINAILPSPTPVGNGTITVTYNNQTSATSPIQVVTAAFGTFTPTYGYGQAIVQVWPSYSLNTIINTFHPNDVGILWGTGLGAILSGSDADTPVIGNIGSPTMYVGNTAVTPVYAGRSSQYPGLDQVNFYVPQGVQGCYVPIAVKAGGTVSNIGTIAVSSAGTNTCSDSVMGQDLVNQLASGSNVSFGYIRLLSQSATYAGLAAAGNSSGDYAYATFSEFTPQTAYLAEYGVSTGYCVASSEQYPADMSIAQLDAGSALVFTVSPLVAPGPMTPEYSGSGYYYLFLGASGKFLYSDYHYTVSGTGGANVGLFAATDVTGNVSAHLTSAVNQNIPRSSDLTLQWSYTDAALQNVPLTIGGYSYSSDLTQAGVFQCTAPAGATSFTIPSWVLSTLPPSGTAQNGSLTYPLGVIWIGQYNTGATFSAPGLNGGVITDAFFQGSLVNFQ
ncbi:MAG: hypothetical protein WB579_22075 [Bryobacteraceae bacterium]